MEMGAETEVPFGWDEPAMDSCGGSNSAVPPFEGGMRVFIDCEDSGRVLMVTLLVGEGVDILISEDRGGREGFGVGLDPAEEVLCWVFGWKPGI